MSQGRCPGPAGPLAAAYRPLVAPGLGGGHNETPGRKNPNPGWWIREELRPSPLKFAETSIFGHTPLIRPFARPEDIGIDTGAVYGNYLTCPKPPAMQF